MMSSYRSWVVGSVCRVKLVKLFLGGSTRRTFGNGSARVYPSDESNLAGAQEGGSSLQDIRSDAYGNVY